MKLLKGILIVLIVIAGLILLIPLFLPAVSTVRAEQEIALTPELIFQNVSLYTDRDKWDPWLTMEPDAKVSITPNAAYVGSVYTWNGDKIGSGKMKVDSVHIPDYIGSSIWFGPDPRPSHVQWMFEESDEGTKVTWQFTSDNSYPFGRLMMVFMKGMLKSSFDSGLENLKSYLEENPPKLYKTGELKIRESPGTNAMILPLKGTMEEISNQMEAGFPKLMNEIQAQGLSVTGPPFTHYLDYDESTGYSHALLAFPVNKKGISSGEMKPKVYEPDEAITAMHYGKYEYLNETYDSLAAYVAVHNIDVTGEAYEIYLKSMNDTKNPMEWQTLVAFTIKK